MGHPIEAKSRARLPIWVCSQRGLASRHVTMTLVRSYHTISPLPARKDIAFRGVYPDPMSRSLRQYTQPAVYFLLHFP